MVRPGGSKFKVVGGVRKLVTPAMMLANGEIKESDLVYRQQMVGGEMVDVPTLKISIKKEDRGRFTKKPKSTEGPKDSQGKGTFKPSKAQLEKIESERAKRKNVLFTETEKEVMREQFISGLGKELAQKFNKEGASIAKEKAAARDRGNKALKRLNLKYDSKMADELWSLKDGIGNPHVRIKKKSRLKALADLEKNGFITGFRDGGSSYLTEKGKAAQKALQEVSGNVYNDKYKSLLTQVNSAGRIPITHPTYGTKYNATYAGLQKILGNDKNVQYNLVKPRVSIRSRKKPDLAGLKKLEAQSKGAFKIIEQPSLF